MHVSECRSTLVNSKYSRTLYACHITVEELRSVQANAQILTVEFLLQI